MRLERTVIVDRPLAAVFAYLSDFTNTTEWDPGTVKTVLRSGDGGVGSTYDNTSEFGGRETQLVYELLELVPGAKALWRGENKTVIAHDTITFREVPGDRGGRATEVTYVADFDFQGAAKLAGPLLRIPLNKLGNDAEKGMRAALLKLPKA